MTDLDRLIAGVEAGTATELQFHTWRPGLTGTKTESRMMWRAYNRDMNAALALTKALLPDRAWGITYGGEYGSVASVTDLDADHPHRAQSPDPARALLLATLRAHRANTGAAHD